MSQKAAASPELWSQRYTRRASLLTYSEKDAHHRGEYKTQSNSIAAFDETGKEIGVVFETATPFDTPRLMTEAVAWVREGMENLPQSG